MSASSPQLVRTDQAIPLLTAETTTSPIVDFGDRVRQAYISWGLLKEGDGFSLSYDRVTTERTNLNLGPIDPRRGEPVDLNSLEYKNDSELEQSYTFKGEKTVTGSISASMTAGFKASTTLKAGVAIKKIIEIGGEKQFEFSLSATITTSLEVQDTKSWDWPIKVPPRSRVVATALTSRYYVDPAFSADIDIAVARHPDFDPGYHPLYVAITRGHETTWYRSSLAAAVQPERGGGFFHGRDQNHVRFRCAGKLSGVYGRGVVVDLKQYPIGSDVLVRHSVVELGGALNAAAGSETDSGLPVADHANAPV